MGGASSVRFFLKQVLKKKSSTHPATPTHPPTPTSYPAPLKTRFFQTFFFGPKTLIVNFFFAQLPLFAKIEKKRDNFKNMASPLQRLQLKEANLPPDLPDTLKRLFATPVSDEEFFKTTLPAINKQFQQLKPQKEPIVSKPFLIEQKETLPDFSRLDRSQLPQNVSKEVLDTLLAPVTKEEANGVGFQMMQKIVQVRKAQNWDPKPKPRLEHIQPFAAKLQCVTVTLAYKTIPPLKSEQVSWLVPDATGKMRFKICFYVDEVRDFILKQHCTTNCKMFAVQELKDVFSKYGIKDVSIPDTMDDDFRAIFLEYDGLARDKAELKKDNVMLMVFEKMQAAIKTWFEDQLAEKIEDESQSSKLVRVFGFFWRMSLRSLRAVGSKVATLIKFVLQNPNYTRLAIIVARSLRVAICIKLSFHDTSSIFINALVEQLSLYLDYYGRLVLDVASLVIQCFWSAMTMSIAGTVGNCGYLTGYVVAMLMRNAFYIPETNRTSAQVGDYLSRSGNATIDFFKSCAASISYQFGLTHLYEATRMMNSSEAELSDIIGLGKDATTKNSARMTFIEWSPYDLRLSTIIFLSNIFSKIAVALPVALPFLKFLLLPLSSIPIITVILAAITTAEGAMPVMKLFLILLLRMLKLKESFDLVFTVLEEIAEWIFDLAPCLFQSAKQKLVQIITLLFSFGMFSFPITSDISRPIGATCCLTPIIRELQKNYIFSERARLQNIEYRKLETEYEKQSYFFFNDPKKKYDFGTQMMQKNIENFKEIRGKQSFINSDLTTNVGFIAGLAIRPQIEQEYVANMEPEHRRKIEFIGTQMGFSPTMGEEYVHTLILVPCTPFEQIQKNHIVIPSISHFTTTWDDTNMEFYFCFCRDTHSFAWCLLLEPLSHFTRQFFNQNFIVFQHLPQHIQQILHDIQFPLFYVE